MTSDSAPAAGTQGESAANDPSNGAAGTVGHGAASQPSDSVASLPGARPWWRLDFVGAVVALLAASLALTPSLLPRPWAFLGLVAGIAAASGYGLGVLAGWVVRPVRPVTIPDSLRTRAWHVLVIAWPVLFCLAVIAGDEAQDEVRALVGLEPTPGAHLLGTSLVMCASALFLLGAARGVRRLTRWVNGHISRVVRVRIAEVLGATAVALLGYALLAGVLPHGAVAVLDWLYAGRNAGTAEGVTVPKEATRSGSVDSLVPWETLGYEGRSFVSAGPDAQTIARATGRPTHEPIRVFVGLESAPTAEERAELAVRELDRTGAFDRAVLVVAGAAGTGWMDARTVEALEYMWGGDTAIVTTQYSHLPSWLSFLVDQNRAAEAGRTLFAAVHAHVSQLPENARPLVVTYGMSLGALAAQAPFRGADDLLDSTAGALFVGPPNASQPWRSLTDNRQPGSPEWRPVVGQGVRFAAGRQDLTVAAPLAQGASSATDGPGAENAPSSGSRVVYLQHASDSVVWWSPDLLVRRPDWLAEPRGPDVSPSVRWLPFITFLQVTVDQIFGVLVPAGHGHNYSDTVVRAWLAVLPPPDWGEADTRRVEDIVGIAPLP